MQHYLSKDERKDIELLSRGYGGCQYIHEQADVTDYIRRRLIDVGKANETDVEKVRAFLKRKDVRVLIAQTAAAVS